MEKITITREGLEAVIERVMSDECEGAEAFSALCTVASMTVIHLNEYLRFATKYPFVSKAVVAALRYAANMMEEGFSPLDDNGPETYKEHVSMALDAVTEAFGKHVKAITIAVPVSDTEKGGDNHDQEA